ncbi:MAG: branched-chain amino acid ABC transporter permease [Thermodesulfobacteriota bacterium]|nr:branched-chain amino acid ABC transporter permease [Thermodesulfobacteriota bacterium]
MTYYVQLVLNGVIAGSIYALFAVGLTMVYGVFRFINFAHGELIALGAYLTLLFTQNIFSLPLYYAVFPALIVTISIGLAQERYIYRPLRHGNRISLLIASIGLSYLLRNGIRIVWGSDLMTYGLKPSRGMEFVGLIITQVQVLMVAAAVLFLCGLYFLFTRTMLGKSLRAVADNMELADIMGINMNRVSMTVWTLASVFAGVGGILLALDTNLEPLMGLTNMIKAFAAMLLGGSGNVWGALLGGLFIGIFENVGVAFFSPGYKDFISFAVIILVLLIRPKGIFGALTGVR